MDRLQRLSERLQLNKFKLQTLLDITRGINDNLPISQLIAIYRGIVQGELELSRLILVSRADQGWETLLHYGDDHVRKIDLPEEVLANYTDITVISDEEAQPIPGFDIVIPVQHQSKALAYLFIGDMADEQTISPIIKHMNFIQTLTNILVVAIENKRLMKESLRQERIRRELELAAEMQAMLVPTRFDEDEDVEVHALYYPHQEVGGDYYDHFRLKDGRHLICIADVSGKGISAAFLMANFQARLRVMSEFAKDMEDLIHQLNRSVVQSSGGDRFVTFFIGVYDPGNSELKYVNAGHNPPLLQSGGSSRWLKKGCMGLGMLDEIPSMEIGFEEINQGDIIICFTDGLVEVENDQREEYGEDRIAVLARTSGFEDVQSLNEGLRADFDAFRGGNPPHDDFALLSVRFL